MRSAADFQEEFSGLKYQQIDGFERVYASYWTCIFRKISHVWISVKSQLALLRGSWLVRDVTATTHQETSNQAKLLDLFFLH